MRTITAELAATTEFHAEFPAIWGAPDPELVERVQAYRAEQRRRRTMTAAGEFEVP